MQTLWPKCRVCLEPKPWQPSSEYGFALNLDYRGIDFGLSEQGEILLFEANVAMVVQQPDEGEQWDYRRPAVELIHNAVRQMLLTRAGVVSA